MIHRGIYHDGIVILQGEVHLRDGDAVVVEAASPPTGRSGRAAAGRPPVKTGKAARSASRPHPFIALAGLWKDRLDWRGLSSLEIVEDLRQRKPASTSTSKRKKARRG